MSSKSQNSLLSPLAAMEEDTLRRTDSCGSLDSHNYNSEEQSFRRNSEPSVVKNLVSPTPFVSSPATSANTSLTSADFMFRPIKEGRPATAGEFSTPRLMRSTTSIGSAPEATHNSIQAMQHSMARHHSLEAARLRSVSPIKYHLPHGSYRPRDVVTSRNEKLLSNDKLYRSVSTVRCESLV